MKFNKRLFPNRIVLLTVAMAVSWIYTVPALAQMYSNQYAVVIGINKYPHAQWPDLTYARNDAEGVAKLMQQLGFTVYTLLDEQATRLKIVSLLEDQLAPRLQKDDAVLFFFAGHGETRTRNQEDFGYIVPHDGTEAAATYVSMEQLETLSRQMGQAKHQVFIMDCCYGGQLGSRGGDIPTTIPEYLPEVGRRVARQILTAGGKDQQVADGGYGGHSVFTGYLLKGIGEREADLNRDGWITFGELATYLIPAASRRNKQTPGDGTLPGHAKGQFLFHVSQPTPPAVVVPSPQPSNVTTRSGNAVTEPKVPSTTPSAPRTYFRSTASTLSDDQVKSMLAEKGFFDSILNQSAKGIQHQYRSVTREGKNLVVDDVTGLTWQQSGSPNSMTYAEVEQYIRDLNNQRFGGYSDWRLPTLEEAMSLVEPTKKSNYLYIDPAFDNMQEWIWTADKKSAYVAWGVYFAIGYCNGNGVYGYNGHVLAVRSGQS